MLYSIDIAEESGAGVEPLQGVQPPEGVKDYAEALVRGVLEKKGDIDRVIEISSDNWSVERMPLVDRNILRIAVYEMRYSDVPFKVAIDEAVELAKRFGTDESGAFVNGILDRMHREAEEKRPEGAPR